MCTKVCASISVLGMILISSQLNNRPFISKPLHFLFGNFLGTPSRMATVHVPQLWLKCWGTLLDYFLTPHDAGADLPASTGGNLSGWSLRRNCSCFLDEIHKYNMYCTKDIMLTELQIEFNFIKCNVIQNQICVLPWRIQLLVVSGTTK